MYHNYLSTKRCFLYMVEETRICCDIECQLQRYNLNFNSILQARPRNLPLIFLSVFYFLFQVFRFVTLVMFAIFMVECSVFHNQTSVDCDVNFTTYNTPGCGAYCWKGMWVGCSVVTCLIGLSVLWIPAASERVRHIRPASITIIARSLVVKPYFWYLNAIVFLVVIYDAIILSQKHVSGSEQVEVGVILSKLLTVILIFQLNFTYPPSAANGFPLSCVALYYMTLSIFEMDNTCKFVELTIRISYKLYTVNSTALHKEVQVISLMLEVVDAALYHNFAIFFWNKIFRGRSDVLMTYSPDLAQSLRGQKQRRATSEDLGPDSETTPLAGCRDSLSRTLSRNSSETLLIV